MDIFLIAFLSLLFVAQIIEIIKVITRKGFGVITPGHFISPIPIIAVIVFLII